jgi:hypothetical protein
MKACVCMCVHPKMFKNASGKPLFASCGTRAFITVETNGSVLDITIDYADRDSHQITWIGLDIQMDDESLCAHV